MSLRKTKVILENLQSLIQSKGYIYALCLIIYEDFHIYLKEIHKVNHQSRLSKNEVSLIIGFLIQTKIDYSIPDTPLETIEMKKKTYELFEELHISIVSPIFKNLEKKYSSQVEEPNIRKGWKSFFSGDKMFIEPIFYANDGVYEFQYLDFLEKKYRYDNQWLKLNRNFEFGNIKLILERIKNVLDEKSKQVNFLSLKENLSDMIAYVKEKAPKTNFDTDLKAILPILEFYQFSNLFVDPIENEPLSNLKTISHEHWEKFYFNLLDLFVIRKNDFDTKLNIEAFLKNFSINTLDKHNNKKFKQIGDFNIFISQPILQLDNERFFIPIKNRLVEACYESPFYWMLQDKNYLNTLFKNRGSSSEDITFELLVSVFGKDKTYRSVKITTNRGYDDTDIDVLCILGNKALCVQVKSKKLTELSRKGDYNKIQDDFKAAIQDAYNQGIVSRHKILEKKSKFYTKDGSEITIPESIDEVYIMGITTENYPSLSYQVYTLLEKEDSEPFPLFLTIFDLEVVSHYLNTPYDLLYYVRQRINLMEYFRAENELVYLSYHLENKLWKPENNTLMVLENDIANAIDRNYYPLRIGAEITDDGDALKNRWKNKDFEALCHQIYNSNKPNITDIIFTLLDWDGESRDKLIEFIHKVKYQTIQDDSKQNFSIISNFEGENSGVTYLSTNNDNSAELLDNLLKLCNGRRYKSRASIWIGFGSLRNSNQLIDTIVFTKQKWEYDKDLEVITNKFFK